MQKISLTIRVDEQDLRWWKAASGSNLSGWIRAVLNGYIEGLETRPAGSPSMSIPVSFACDECGSLSGHQKHCTKKGK
jgi:hypothetical protein